MNCLYIKKRLCFFILFVSFIAPLTADAGLISTLAKLGKAAKTVKVIKAATLAESANAVFSKIGSNAKKIGLYIGKEADNQLTIHSSTGEIFQYSNKYGDIGEFIADVIMQTKSSSDTSADAEIEFYISEALYFTNRKILGLLKKIEDLVIVMNDRRHLRTKLIATDSGTSRAIIVADNVYVSVASAAQLENLFWFFKQAFAVDKLGFVSLLDNKEQLQMNKVLNKTRVDSLATSQLMEQALADTMLSLEGKTLMIMAHVEGDHILVDDSDSNLATKISLATLEDHARSNKVSLLLLNYKADTEKVSGATRKLNWNSDVLLLLENAFKSKSYGALFSVFGSKSPLVIESVLSNQSSFEISTAKNQNLSKDNKNNTSLLSQIRILTPGRAYISEMNSRIVWFLPSWVHQSYFVLYLLSFLTFKRAWQWHKKLWSLPGISENNPVYKYLQFFVHLLTYLVLLPLYTLFIFVITPFIIIYRIVIFLINSLIFIYNVFISIINLVTGRTIVIKKNYITRVHP